MMLPRADPVNLFGRCGFGQADPADGEGQAGREQLGHASAPTAAGRPRFCHADAATCQNSAQVPQIADKFRHASSHGCAPKSLQNSHLQKRRVLDRTQEAAGSSPASSTPRTPAISGGLGVSQANRRAAARSPSRAHAVASIPAGHRTARRSSSASSPTPPARTCTRRTRMEPASPKSRTGATTRPRTGARIPWPIRNPVRPRDPQSEPSPEGSLPCQGSSRRANVAAGRRSAGTSWNCCRNVLVPEQGPEPRNVDGNPADRTQPNAEDRHHA